MISLFSLQRLALVMVLVVAVASQECNELGHCDKDEQCSVWKEQGKCQSNKSYMAGNCPISCGDLDRLDAVHDITNSSDDRSFAETECEDQLDRCWRWAELGECDANPNDMMKYCALSCGVCGDQNRSPARQECKDHEISCSGWAKEGECLNNPRFMFEHCAKSCNACDFQQWHDDDEFHEIYANYLVARSVDFGVQQTAEGVERKSVIERLESTIRYLASDQVMQLSAKIRRECMNRHHQCTFWQFTGECDINTIYMNTECVAACQTCHKLEELNQCQTPIQQVPVLIPGDLNQLFQKIIEFAPGHRSEETEHFLQKVNAYQVPHFVAHVHSRPSQKPVREVSIVQDKSLPPWVVSLDNFMSGEECDALIEIGIKLGYEGSSDNKLFPESARCADSKDKSPSGCRNEELPATVHERLSKVLRLIPAEYSEDLLFVKYQEGQYEESKHDYIPEQKDLLCGPRVLSTALFLNNAEFGGIKFPKLNITIAPKKGTALLWPNVLDSEPLSKDPRLLYEFLPNSDGFTFVVFTRFHIYDFVDPQLKGCV